MKKEDLKKLIEDNKTDDGFNIDAIFENVDKFIGDIKSGTKKATEEEVKTKFKSELEMDIFKNLGIDGVSNGDEFKTHVETIGKSTDNNAKTVTELQGKLNETTKSFEELQKNYESTLTDSRNKEFKLDIFEQDYDQKYINAIQAEYQTRTQGKDEFEKQEIHESIKKDFPEFVKGYSNGLGSRKPAGEDGGGGTKHKNPQGFFGGAVKPK